MAATQSIQSIYDIQVQSIDGKPYPLGEYKGHPLLIVNTASECGFTPQYEGLEKLYEKFKSKGLVVLGMPCNQFGGQEPGSEKEIKKFCELKFHVQFPMLSKADVKGANQHPLYKYLLEHAPEKGDVKWNFEKFLVDGKGKVVGRFRSKVEPESDELIDAVKKAL